MKLAELVATDGPDNQSGLLKRLYLALPYSEKGIRLHLRRLESGGWITVHKIGEDGRTTRVELSAAYWGLLSAYAVQWGVLTEVVGTAEQQHVSFASPDADTTG